MGKSNKLNYKQRQKQNRLMYEKKTTSFIAVAASAFFIAVTAVFPLYISKSKYQPLTYPKAFFFWVITLTAAAVVLCTLLFVKNTFFVKDYYIKDEPKRFLSVPEWSLAAFMLLTLISALAASFDKEVSGIVWLGDSGRYEGFLSFLCYVLTFFIIARFYKPKHLHFLMAAGSAILVSLYGILQFLGADIFKLFPFEAVNKSTGLPFGEHYGPLSAYFRTTMGNIDIASAYCSFAVLLFAGLFACSRFKSKWNWLYFAASAASFALFLITDVDATKVGILAAMVLLVPYWISDRERLGRILIAASGWCAVFIGYNAYLSNLKGRHELDPSAFKPYDGSFLSGFEPANTLMFCVLAAVLLAAGLALLILLKKWPVKQMKTGGIIFVAAAFAGGLLFVEIMGSRWSDNPGNIIWQAREMMHGRFGDNFGSGRGWVWKNGFSVIFNHPVLGKGPDTFWYALGEELQIAASQAVYQTFDKAHNIFLQIAVCMGIPALLAYVVFLGSVFVSAIKKAFDNPVLLAFGASALCYMIQSFFCVEVPITTPLVWVCLGVMAGEIWKEKIGFREADI